MTTTMRRVEFRRQPTKDKRLPKGFIDIPEFKGYYGVNDKQQIYSLHDNHVGILKCDAKNHFTMNLYILGVSTHIMKSQVDAVYKRALTGSPIGAIVTLVKTED